MTDEWLYVTEQRTGPGFSHTSAMSLYVEWHFTDISGLSHLSSHEEQQRRLLILGFVLGHKLLCYWLNELLGRLQFPFLLCVWTNQERDMERCLKSKKSGWGMHGWMEWRSRKEWWLVDRYMFKEKEGWLHTAAPHGAAPRRVVHSPTNRTRQGPSCSCTALDSLSSSTGRGCQGKSRHSGSFSTSTRPCRVIMCPSASRRISVGIPGEGGTVGEGNVRGRERKAWNS